MAFYYHYCLRGLILSHIKYVIELQHENKLNVKKYFIISTAVFVVILMSQIVTYLIVDKTFTPL